MVVSQERKQLVAMVIAVVHTFASLEMVRGYNMASSAGAPQIVKQTSCIQYFQESLGSVAGLTL